MPLDSLLHAVRVAQRVARRSLVASVPSGQAGLEAVVAISELTADYSDTVSSVIASSYADQRRDEVAEAERLRRDLLDQMLSGAPAHGHPVVEGVLDDACAELHSGRSFEVSAGLSLPFEDLVGLGVACGRCPERRPEPRRGDHRPRGAGPRGLGPGGHPAGGRAPARQSGLPSGPHGRPGAAARFCSIRWVEQLGFWTIPRMATVAFVLIVVALTLDRGPEVTAPKPVPPATAGHLQEV